MIKINEKYYITADANQYVLQEKTVVQDKGSKNHGKEAYITRGYYPTIEGCLNGIIKKESREYILKQYIVSIEEAINKMENIRQEITNSTKNF